MIHKPFGTAFLSALALGFGLVLSVQPARAGDWPRLLGPAHDCKADPKDADGLWATAGLQREWEFSKGKGWAPPAVSGGRVLLFQRVDSQEVLDCLDLKSGKTLWRFAYDAPYRDRYGSGDGARTSPVVEDGKVWIFGITGKLHCVDFGEGKLLWARDLGADYAMRDNFFGHGSTPLVFDGKVIVPVGGSEERCVVALDAASGREVWVAKHAWGAGYSSLIPARAGGAASGKPVILLFAGGESRPPTGGLLCIDTSNGRVLGEVPHRARIAESVNAASPVLVGEDKVLTTEGYGSGAMLSRIEANGQLTKVWSTVKLGSQFHTPIFRDGVILGFDGQNSRLAELVCLDAQTGEERWRDDLGGRFGRGNMVDLGKEGVLVLGEFGELLRFKLEGSERSLKVQQREPLFHAAETWSLPVIAQRRLLVMQNERSSDGASPRLICYRY